MSKNVWSAQKIIDAPSETGQSAAIHDTVSTSSPLELVSVSESLDSKSSVSPYSKSI